MNIQSFLKSNYTKAVLIFVLLICIFYYPIIFGGKAFGSPDTLTPKSAGIALNKSWEETGEFPLWQPWIFSGMPTVEAFSFVSVLYFPSYIFKVLFISGITSQLFHFLFAAFGCYLLMLYLTKNHWLGIFSGASFMLMPYMTTMIVFGHGSQMMTAAYIPWIVLFTLKLIKHPSLLNVGILAILMGFQLQRAHVQIAYYTWLLVGAYVVWFLISELINKKSFNSILKPIGFFGISAVLALGLAMIVFYPSFSYADFSVRGAGTGGGAAYNYATGWSFHPKEILTFFIPSAYGFGGITYWGHMPFTDYPNYMGILIFLLAILGAIKNRNSMTNFLVASSLLALFISFGKHFSFFYDLFFNYFPYFNKFRVPSMILILVQFNTTILAALGLQKLIDDNSFITKYRNYIFGTLVFIALVLLFGDGMIRSSLSNSFTAPRVQDQRTASYIQNLRQDMWLKDAWISLFFVASFCIGCWATTKQIITNKIFFYLTIALVIVDIGIVNLKIIDPEKNSGRNSQLISDKMVDRVFEKDNVVSFLIQDHEKPFRIYPLGQWFAASRFRAFHIESVGGYHPAKLNNYNTFLSHTNNAGSLPLIRMLNVRYLISPQRVNLLGARFVHQGKLGGSSGFSDCFIYQIDDALPRAWFVSKVASLVDENALWQNLTSGTFHPTEVGYAINEPELNHEYQGGEILESNYQTNDIKIKLKTEDQAFLIVSEINYPLRWKAFLDDTPIATHEINGILRGFEIPPGEHTLSIHYDRSAFYTGIFISIMSFLASVGLVIAGFKFSN